MPKVTISKKEIEIKQDLTLNNGDLIIYKDKIAMVTTYDGRSEYCALVDLSTGSRICQEPCSRKTTRKRVGAHLRHWVGSYNAFASVSYNKIEHHKHDKYEIDIKMYIPTSGLTSNAQLPKDALEEIEVQIEHNKNQCPNCGYCHE